MKLNFGTKLSYGIGGIADNTMYTLAGTYLLFYLTTVVGINPAVAGTITALGSIWEAVCGPIFGYVSDGIETKYGKRKPFLMAAAFPIAIVSTMLFTTFDLSGGVKIAYYLIMTLLFWTGFSSFFVPYMAWGSELTEDYDERTVLRSYAYLFNQVGMAIGMVLPTVIVDLLVDLGKSASVGWQAVGAVCGLCSGGALLICALTNKKSDNPAYRKPANKEKTISIAKLKSMFIEYFQIIKLKPIRYIIGASIAYLVTNTIFSSARVYYLTFNIGFTSSQISFTMLAITVLGIAFVPLIATLSNKWDKKHVFAIGIGVSGVLMMAMRFIDISTMPMVLILCLVYSIANTCYWQLMPSMIYDVCEVEEFFSGEKHSGAVISLQALSESVAMAIGLQMLGLILKWAGFANDAATQSATALTWVSNTFTFIPGLFMVVVVVAIMYYPVDKGVFDRIVRAIECEKKGESYDRAGILKILGIKTKK